MKPQSPLRKRLEGLAVGQALLVEEHTQKEFVINARGNMKPKKFSVKRVPRVGWNVERVQ